MKIKNVKAFITAPEKINLVVIRVETDQDGLYGYGCGTFTQRCLSVVNVVENYLAPLLIGRDPQNIEDIWNMVNVNAYWRNGPVLNSALSSVDMALWDIKGKIANLPLYQLFGGKCRNAVPAYAHAEGSTKEDVLEKAQMLQADGYKYIRCQQNGYGGVKQTSTDSDLPGNYYDPKQYKRDTIEMFDFLRSKLGYELELIHDVHERLYPIDTIQFAKDLEPYRLFFLEDALSPEQTGWYSIYRQQCSTPIAIGELFNNPNEWVGLMQNRLIDFIRIHISQIGGITPARKVVALAGAFQIRTAWHGPGDLAPFSHAANIHLDLSTPNFGIQEWCRYSESVYEVFEGTPYTKEGMLYITEKPGLGVGFDEKKAKKHPFIEEVIQWTQSRHPDGTIFTP